jgi:hypothetical protein
VSGKQRWHPLRAELGISAFGVNAWVGDTGDELIEPHDELGAGAAGHEELYVVVRGRARFVVDEIEHDGPAGTAVFVPDPASRRVAYGEEDGTVVLVVGAQAGEAFAPSAWEVSSLAAEFARRGDGERATGYRAESLERHPDHLHTLYNIACAEALAGDREAALDHLARAVAAEPAAAEWAREDRDLDAIRDDPRFPRAEAASE